MPLTLRYRIIAASAPRVAAQQSSYCKVQSFDRPMFAKGLNGILRTGWSKSACWRFEWGDANLIEPDKEQQGKISNFPQ